MSTTTAADGRRIAFAWLWAVAVILHLLYLAGSFAAFESFTFDHALYLVLGVGAIALLCRPRSTALLAFVCILTPITAWEEAPALGNHWLLASLISLALLGSMAIGALRRPRDVGGSVDRDGFPVARLVFLIAYGFAALSKFNTSFADPTVSCANVFADQVARSVGLSGLHATSGDGWTHLVPIAVMAIETSVVVLLVIARTRVLGVIVALVFHGIISLDTEHAFSDFTSLIAAIAVLFLPDRWFADLAVLLRRSSGRMLARVATAVVAATSTLLLVWQSTDTNRQSWRAIGHGRDALWWAIGAAVLGIVVLTAIRTRTIRADVALLPRDRWLLAVPGAAVLIGLGPWLGVRTGTSWNMYANLVTARGETNAWFAPGTLRLLDEPDDLVRIVASTDPALDPYIDSGERTPFVNLRLYTSSHPDFSITYERDGVTTTVDHSRVDDELGSAPEWWWRKVLTYRSVDIDGPARCQDTMWALR